ncbi:MAG: glycerophosphodiester phosphodiesterase [Verrucomicrobia bacterium]|nr:glycerophosphodiester phosphodiesterase [Verrucomicrobiota bacterium]
MTTARPIIVAHRGASHDAPENTLEAFALAWQQGADAVEGDFRLTADRRLACIHDATTRRTTNRNLRVSRATLAQLQALDAGIWKGPAWAGARIPSLDDILDALPGNKKLFMEIKCGVEAIAPLVRALKRAAVPPQQLAVISFNARVVAAAHSALPQIPAYWISAYRWSRWRRRWTPTPDRVLQRLRAIRAAGFASQNHPEANQHLADGLKGNGYAWNVWTVDALDDARRFSQLGVDSLTTNSPLTLRRLLKD